MYDYKLVKFYADNKNQPLERFYETYQEAISLAWFMVSLSHCKGFKIYHNDKLIFSFMKLNFRKLEIL